MKKFMDKNFLLETKTARKLFFNYAEKCPVFDYHNHLSAKEIYENKSTGNLANAWLDHDHYKWRAMRAYGVDESMITGHLYKDGSVKPIDERGGKDSAEKQDFQRYFAFVKTIQGCTGNPLYHWTHLELQRYFGVYEPLNTENAISIWNKCNSLLSKKEYSPRNLLSMMDVRQLCTTDDPCDNLEYHKLLAVHWSKCKVLPSFRPDNVLDINSNGFIDYIKKLGEITHRHIYNIDDLILALNERILFFKDAGCVVSDHSIEGNFFNNVTVEEANEIFVSALEGKIKSCDIEKIRKYKTFLLTALGKLYRKNGIVMQLHIGAMRDNNETLFQKKGKNIGMDSINDFNCVSDISSLLNNIDSVNETDSYLMEIMPYNTENKKLKSILYNLNPKDNEAFATLAADFPGCMFGPAWWFNDHKDGIEEQLKVFARTSVLSKNIGMLTDSRSFLSFTRHEYYRRILCNFIGNLVEKGEYPWDERVLGKMVQDICYNNALDYFSGIKNPDYVF